MQSSKFYLPFFKTNCPNGSLFVYENETSNQGDCWSDSNGLFNLINPIELDYKGDCVLYIDSDKLYRFVLYDENDVLIYDLNNIKSTKGAPGPHGGPIGPTGVIGKQGEQGLSGQQGSQGPVGLQGIQGLSFYSKTYITENKTITIPKGIKEIYITGTAAGGASASWSPYMFFGYLGVNYDKDDINNFSSNLEVSGYDPVGETSFLETYNVNTTKKIATCFSTLSPGSGFEGDSIYRHKIGLESEKTNTITFIIGKAGQPSTDTFDLKGGDGENTTVFVNGVMALTLKGGKGGENNFSPVNSLSNDENNYTIRQNFGFNKYYLYTERTGAVQTLLLPGEFTNNLPFSSILEKKIYAYYNSSSVYSFKNIQANIVAGPNWGGSFELTPVSMYQLDEDDIYNYQYQGNFLFNPNGGEQFYKGGETIFGNYYSVFKDKRKNANSVKTTTGRLGYGAGGDIINYMLDSHLRPPMYIKVNILENIVFFNKKISIDLTTNLLQSFSPPDKIGDIQSIPGPNDGQWNILDDYVNELKLTNTVIDKSGFILNFNIADNNQDTIEKTVLNNPYYNGQKGTKGFCLLEIGSITDNTDLN